jgi:transcriptional regulator with XRE-family HTH domain
MERAPRATERVPKVATTAGTRSTSLLRPGFPNGPTAESASSSSALVRDSTVPLCAVYNKGTLYAARLKEIRQHRGWTQQRLADEMRRIGYPISRPAIAKIERGKRPLEVGEFVALGVALGVPPSGIFLPLDAEFVQLTEKVKVPLEVAAAWANGDAPLDPKDARFYHSENPGVTYAKTGGAPAGAHGGGVTEGGTS